MYLIVGLGNIGKEYIGTRHNLGFYFLDHYLETKGLSCNKKKLFYKDNFLETKINGSKVIFLKPATYMNLSGMAVKRFVDYYKIPIENILVISDDLDLNVGSFKLKEKGSCGGHRGLLSIEKSLKTDNYKRLKIGISNNKNIDTKDYVLGRFSQEEQAIYKSLIPLINEIIDSYFIFPFADLMSKYNKKNGK